MSKLSSHRSFFGNRYSIAVSDLQSGMIVDFSYRKTSSKETKRYTVMIVDPAYKRVQDKENFTHAINLDIAPRAAILDIARRTGATMANSRLEANMVYADKLLVEGQPREFFQSNIADLISGQGKGSYRTFKTLKIQGIQLIDYTFPDSIDYYDPSELDENEN
mgnify:FL=1